MPLDLASIQQDKEKQLADLLASRKTAIPSSLDAARAKIEGSRDIASPVNQVLGGLGINASIGGDVLGRLQRTLSRNLAGIQSRQRYGFDRETTGLVGQNLNRIQGQARGAQLDTQNFANQYAAIKREQDFAAQQSMLDRQAQDEIEAMKDQYAKRGLALEEQYQPSYDYGSALARLMGGLIGVGGTAYLLRNKTTPVSTTANTAGVGGYGIPRNYNTGYGTAGVGGYGGY